MEIGNQFLGTERIDKLMRQYAVPCIISLLVGALYNIVDQIFIANASYLGSYGNAANTVVFPLTVVALAIAVMVGDGCCAFVSMALGRNETARAKRSVGNAVVLIIVGSLILTAVYLIFANSIIAMFGGTVNEETYRHSQEYFFYITLGIPFYMFGQAMNPIIRADGNPKFAMISTLAGAVINIILDPIFIFGLHMGVRGAALATIISQICSGIWVLRFLTGKKVTLRLNRLAMVIEWARVKEIMALGISGFMMQFTNGLVQIFCNSTLHMYGGDIYVGVMTVLNSVRDIATMMVHGLTNGASPVMSFNYGEKAFGKVKQAIKFVTVVCFSYALFVWGIIKIMPEFFIKLFNNDPTLLEKGVPALHIYFFGFCFMALQFTGQAVFVALGKAKRATFFSIFRKVIIVVPLTVLLPRVGGLGVDGVFWAEPISNLIGGCVCFFTMLATILPELKEK